MGTAPAPKTNEPSRLDRRDCEHSDKRGKGDGVEEKAGPDGADREDSAIGLRPGDTAGTEIKGIYKRPVLIEYAGVHAKRKASLYNRVVCLVRVADGSELKGEIGIWLKNGDIGKARIAKAD